MLSSMYAPHLAIDGSRAWGYSGGWRDGTPDNYPDWLQVDFNGSKTINEINVFAVRDDFSSTSEPTETETFSLYGITSFNLQYWSGSNWVTVPNGNVTSTNRVVTKLTFAPITTSKIRVVVNNAQASYSRIVEVEAWTGGSQSAAAHPVGENPRRESLSRTVTDWLNYTFEAIGTAFSGTWSTAAAKSGFEAETRREELSGKRLMGKQVSG